MNKYKVAIKPPSGRATIWAGPQSSRNSLPAPETDTHRVRRENVGNRLESLTGVKPEWNLRQYCYFAELEEEQVLEVTDWDMVRSVTEA